LEQEVSSMLTWQNHPGQTMRSCCSWIWRKTENWFYNHKDDEVETITHNSLILNPMILVSVGNRIVDNTNHPNKFMKVHWFINTLKIVFQNWRYQRQPSIINHQYFIEEKLKYLLKSLNGLNKSQSFKARIRANCRSSIIQYDAVLVDGQVTQWLPKMNKT
jgi:hypothetical protein